MNASGVAFVAVFFLVVVSPSLGWVGGGRPGFRGSWGFARGHIVPAHGDLLRHLADGAVVVGVRLRVRAGGKQVREVTLLLLCAEFLWGCFVFYGSGKYL